MTAAPATSPRPRRWPRVVLAVSLVLNILFIGLVAGRLLAGGVFGPAPFGGPPMRELPELAQALPDDERDMAWAAFRERAPELRTAFMAIGAARDGVMDALAAEPFDPDAMDAALAALRERTEEAQAVVHGALAEISRNLSPEGRHAVVEAARGMGRRMGHGGLGALLGGGPGPGPGGGPGHGGGMGPGEPPPPPPPSQP